MRLHTCVCVCIRDCVYVHGCVYGYVSVCVYMHVCFLLYVFVCMIMCVYLISSYTFLLTNISMDKMWDTGLIMGTAYGNRSSPVFGSYCKLRVR